MEKMEATSRWRRRCSRSSEARQERYFILLEDIWSTRAWEVINCALPETTGLRSRVLTTTCVVDVAKSCSMHPVDVLYKMQNLTWENSVSLLRSKISIPREEMQACFKEVADKKLKICGGMPLAIIVAAGLLSRKFAELEQSKSLDKCTLSAPDQYSTPQVVMRKILDMSYDDLSLPQSVMTKILDMSYADLSLPAKSCFLYLSTFPENYTIKKDRLIRLWIAERFFTKGKGESLWETGESYFNELISRRLIQPVFDDDDGDDDGEAVGCTVHGVIVDFIASMSGPFPGDRIRRLSLDVRNQDEADDILEPSTAHSRVRSLTVFRGDAGWMPNFSAFKLVRVLDLEDTETTNFNLESIASLSLLRYLGLRGTGVAVLPEQIGQLQQLETLDLRGTRVTQLPKAIDRLQKLVSLLGDELQLQTGFQLENMQDLEEVSTIAVNSSGSRAALKTSKRLRVLGISLKKCPRDEMLSFLNELRESNIVTACLELHGDLVVLDDWAPSPLLPRFRLRKHLPRVPEKWAALHHLRHLDICIAKVTMQDLSVLMKLPNLILLKLDSEDYAPVGCIISTGFVSLEVAWFRCRRYGRMGLQFAYGSMRKLRRLHLDFHLRELSGSKFDFGIQYPSSLVQVHVTINCSWCTTSVVLAAEDAIRRQVNDLPKRATLEFIRREESYMWEDA